MAGYWVNEMRTNTFKEAWHVVGNCKKRYAIPRRYRIRFHVIRKYVGFPLMKYWTVEYQYRR